MRITVLCIGKLKEKYLTEGVAEFAKRLTPFAKLEIRELPEEKTVEKETDKLIEALPEHAYIMLLDVIGEQISSPELAAKFDALTLSGVSHICFVIGGAFGYTDALRKAADFRWSFSKLTFTHQMIRLFLVEQIYRAFMISNHRKYHW